MLDALFRRRSSWIDVPIFDGALKPNQILAEAEIVSTLDSPEDISFVGEGLCVADGSTIRRIESDGTVTTVLNVGAPVTAFTGFAGGIACVLAGREVAVFGGSYDGWRTSGPPDAPFMAVNSLTVEEDRLIASDGSRDHSYADWRRDLMTKCGSGRVFRLIPAADTLAEIARDLGHPFGAISFSGGMLVSEAWRHRLIALDARGRQTVVYDHLPGYPSRIAKVSDGYWLTMFCPRNQLVEFVLSEDEFRDRMISTIDPDLWLSPQLQTGRHLQEPLQWAGQLAGGEVMPWAPTLSYGLVVKLDQNGRPDYSIHSRAGGPFHGVAAVAERDGVLYLLSKGDRVVLRLGIDRIRGGVSQ